MSEFICRLGTPSGEIVTRVVEATAAGDARVQLEREGFKVFAISTAGGGIAMRTDGLRGGRDFILYAADVTHYFSAANSSLFDREAQTTFGLGVEYNYDFGGGARVPVRVGYSVVPGGGFGYGDRNAFTFGIGYRPANTAYSIDLNLASPQHGGFDLGLSVGYKLGR